MRSPLGQDIALAVVFLVAAEAELLGLPGRTGPLPLEVLLVGALMVGLAVRRIAPMGFVAGETVGVVLLAACLDVNHLNVPSVFLFVPPYTIARYAPVRRAVVGLGLCLAGAVAVDLLSTSDATSWSFSLGVVCASWATGRSIRTHRLLAEQLDAKAHRVVAEREAREQLAVAEERTRIAHQLQAVVVTRVSQMSVHAGNAARMIDQDVLAADASMAAIEALGHQVLADMRDVLGVLRRPEEDVSFAPAPGIGQIPELGESCGRVLVLRVDGEPAPLPASVDLGAYRLVEDALGHLDELEAYGEPMEVTVRFGERDVELDLSVAGGVPLAWPTAVMREWVGLCGGSLSLDVTVGGSDRADHLRARLPRQVEETFA